MAANGDQSAIHCGLASGAGGSVAEVFSTLTSGQQRIGHLGPPSP
jgi:hypothetical protein